MDIVSEWEEKNKPFRIHKGTPFYFWAVTFFLKDDVETGFLLMNEAYLEDELTLKEKAVGDPANLPAGSFLYLDASNETQFFKPKLDQIKNFLEQEFIVSYCQTRNRNMSYSDFEAKFLRSKKVSKEVKLHFNLSLFRLQKLMKRLPRIKEQNTLVCLWDFEVIFDLCRVLEYLIKVPQRDNFADDIKQFAQKYKLSSVLRQVNNRDFHTDSFFSTLAAILNDTYTINNCKPDELEKDILISYGFRNFGAHRIEENEIVIKHFSKLVNSVMNTIFLACELSL